LEKGVVIKSTGSYFIVKDEGNQKIECTIKGNFRIRGFKSTSPIVVGDFVDFEIQKNISKQSNRIGVITNLYDRKNYIVRRSQNLSKQSHILAANIDQAFLIITLAFPTTTTTFIDRFLATAEAYRIPTILVFNKTDLLSNSQVGELDVLKSIYSKIGYNCIYTSAVLYSGIQGIKELTTNKTSLFTGHSGVGKSTLLNCIQPGLNLKTKEISEHFKTGKHSTTYSEMYELDLGGYIIDTPGIKAFGMSNMESWEISHYFPEFFRLSNDCQFNNCTHTHEPGCAIKEGIKNGTIAESRYISYLGLLNIDEKYRMV
jgi:ribosome biogenesis GTPase / thiamine phosphate phosphatase